MQKECDAIVIGAGFAGLVALYRLRTAGLRTLVIEAAEGVGGTWYWNRYPGARCDVESFDYSYQFSEELQQEWEWSERYAAQPEILRYLEHVADRFDLRRDIRFSTRVTAAHFDGSHSRWTVSSADGPIATARWLVMASGSLSRPNMPPLPGLDRFEGELLHTAAWPHAGVDFAGKRVAVIGTGSSGVQAIPLIAREAERLTVFQRTANFCVPAHNRPSDPQRVAQIKADYPAFRAMSNAQSGGAQFSRPSGKAREQEDEARRTNLEQYWATGGLHFQSVFSDIMFDTDANRVAADFVREKIAGIVADPATAKRLSPDQMLGCKRLSVGTDYYETFNRPNVELIDIRADPIISISEDAIHTSGGACQADAIVFATGFDALTGALAAIDIRGREGRALRTAWEDGPATYLGIAVAGFPNLFVIAGPGSPAVLSNVVASIEQQVEWVVRCIAVQEADGVVEFEAEAAAQDAWVATVNGIADRTIYPTCNSWYLGANIAGKPRVFMPFAGGLPAYRERCEAVAASGYEGFRITRRHAAPT